MMSKRFIPVILFVGLLVGGSYYYLCEIKHVCGEFGVNSIKTTVHNDSTTEAYQPLIFQYNSAEPVVGNDFAQYRDNLIGKIGEMDTLLVNGKYYSNEYNGRELAQERADNVKALLDGHFDLTRLKTQINFDGMTTVDDQSNLEAVSFTIVTQGNEVPVADTALEDTEDVYADESSDDDTNEDYEDGSEQTSDSESEIGKKALTSDRAVIYFPKMSVKKNMTPETRSFIDGLVDLMKEDPNVKVYVIGHSYGENDDGELHQLGRRRAWVVKKMIWDRGVNPMRIITSSKGETEPVNNGGDEANEAYNRRVEIIIDRQ